MSTFTGEETYLEAFVEQFTSSQFTYQLRRTLDLLRDLDATGQAEGRAAQELSHEFLGHVERKIRQTLQVVISSNEGDGEGPERKRPRRGVRVISSEDTVATEDLPMIPTTEELLEYILQEEHHSTTYQRILELQQSCRQNAEEKVQIAQQAYELVDAQVQRLDHDLRAMEQLLQVRFYCLMYLILYIPWFTLVRFSVHGRFSYRIGPGHGRQTQRLGRLSSDTGHFGMDLGQGLASRSLVRNLSIVR
jgi:Inhibitor of growth proteins N-terminal histone-binding